MNAEERYSRQRDIVPADRLAECKATVVGVGAIGRPVALQLAAMGVPWLQLVDFDIVEGSNLASQGFLEDDLGWKKVDAVATLCSQINSHTQIHRAPKRFRRSLDIGNVLFCCVDSIVTRRLIWEALKGSVLFFCDGRMSAEVCRIVTACDAQGREHYPTTLFSPEEAQSGPCTARTTIYCANVAAGLMLAQFTKWLRHFPVEVDLSLNLLTDEMATNTPHR